MRRIYITKHIREIAKEYADDLFKNRKTKFEKPLTNLESIKNHLTSEGKTDHVVYISQIIKHFYFLLRIEPQYFDRIYTKHFESILSELQLSEKYEYKKKNKPFYEHIVDIMRYDAVRDEDFLRCVKKLNIRTCINCNGQFAVTTSNNDGKISGRYELDHFYPKSKYPFLCISFFNLHPSCSHCNKSKSSNGSEFSLYTNNHNDLSPFQFSIDKSSLIKYMLSQNSEDLNILFDCPNSSSLRDNHQKNFHITELYEMQKDIAEEVIWKAKIYNKSYQKSLEESFSRLFVNKSDFNRFILGNYDKPEDIHKRPMAKLVQDIAKQLGLL